MRTVRLGLLF